MQRNILDAIKALPYPRSGADHVSGMELLRTEIFRPEKGDRPSVPNVVISVSVSNADRRQDEVRSVMLALLEAVPEIVLVRVTEHTTPTTEEIAAVRSLGTQVYLVDRFQDLGSMIEEVVEETCREVGKLDRQESRNLLC